MQNKISFERKILFLQNIAAIVNFTIENNLLLFIISWIWIQIHFHKHVPKYPKDVEPL